MNKPLIDLGIDSDATVNGQVLTADIADVQSLDLSDNYLNDLTGLEDFSSLKILDISRSGLNNGTYPHILDLTALTNLEELYINGDLDNIQIYVNIIDLSNNPNLRIIEAQGNWDLETINLQGSDQNIDILNLDFHYSYVCVHVTNPTDAQNGEGQYSNWTVCCDGDYTFSDTCNLGTEKFSMESVKLYPNPVTEQFTINSPSELKAITIYNLQGRLVKSYFQQESYAVSDLAKGIYLVELEAINNQRIFLKFVKK